jgi:CRP-like cAMP-binding protein
MSISISKDGWQELIGISSRKLFPAGSEIYSQGATPQAAYFINRGLIKLLHTEPDGNEVIISLRVPNRWLGLVPAVLQRPYKFSAISLTECELLCVPIETFLKIIETDRDFSLQTLKAACRNVIALNDRLTQTAVVSARQRLEYLLWQLLSLQSPGNEAKNARLSLPLKKKEIAQIIAVTPSYISELLDELETLGLVRQENRRNLIIIDPQRLWRETDPEMF